MVASIVASAMDPGRSAEELMSGPISASDRIAIGDLVVEYARCVDRRDYSGLARLFAPSSRIGTSYGDSSSPVRWSTGGEEFAELVKSGHAQYRVTSHFLGQHSVRGDTSLARGELYCTANHICFMDDAWVNRVMSIRYQDLYGRSEADGDPGQWVFTERLLMVDWIELRPMHTAPGEVGWVADGWFRPADGV